MEYKDYYKVLGVPKTATADEIKKAYRKLVRKYHPDLSKEKDAADKTAEINEAYAVLSDEEKRTAYDSLGNQPFSTGEQGFQPPPDWGSHFSFTSGGDTSNFSDFFEELFGRTAQSKQSGARYQREPMSRRGDDQYAQISLSIEDAYHGTEQTLILNTTEVDEQGYLVNKEAKTHVKIPKGVYEGQHIRLAGKGHPGIGGAPAGDLLLEVKFKPDPRWRADGRDVYQPLPLAPWEAALGKVIVVVTPAGNRQVTIPAGAKAGSKLRLKGLGIPAKEPGNLYLELEISNPTIKTDQERQAFEALANLYPDFNPRHNTGA